MWEEILKGFSLVYLPSMVKFIFGPLAGYAAGLNLLTTIIATTAGMMTIVFMITYFGDWFRKNILDRFYKNRKRFSERNRKFAVMWKKYGLVGVAFLTPLILTPIGGALLAVSFGGPREKIIFYMFLSGAIWAIIFSTAIYFFGDKVLPDFVR